MNAQVCTFMDIMKGVDNWHTHVYDKSATRNSMPSSILCCISCIPAFSSATANARLEPPTYTAEPSRDP